jgi:hypothetical protein
MIPADFKTRAVVKMCSRRGEFRPLRSRAPVAGLTGVLPPDGWEERPRRRAAVLLDGAQDGLRIERLRDVPAGERQRGLEDRAPRRRCRDDDDGRGRSEVDLLEELVAVHHRHEQIEQDHARPAHVRVLESVERLAPVGRRRDLVPLHLQEIAEPIADVPVVVDDHDESLTHGVLSLP